MPVSTRLTKAVRILEDHFLPAGAELQTRSSSLRSGAKPKSALKSFALSLPEFDEPELQLSSAKSMKAGSKRVSSVANGLLRGLEVGRLSRVRCSLYICALLRFSPAAEPCLLDMRSFLPFLMAF